MTQITFQDGKVVVRGGKVGTEQECCCEPAGEENNCGCCSAEEYADCEIQVRLLLPGDQSYVLDTVSAASLFTNDEGVGCRFAIRLGDENTNRDQVCRVNGEIDPDIETCEECEAAGGECVECCDTPRIVACMQPTEDGRCQLTIQTIDNCAINATSPVGPCNGYDLVMTCNPLP